MKTIESETQPSTAARSATLAVIVAHILPNFINPVPHPETVRGWLDDANIPRFKAKPTAKRGGGPCYYSLSHVEKFLRSRMVAPTR